MLLRYATKRPQRVLKPFGQGHEALTAEHDVSVLKARERQSKVMEPVIQRLAGNRDLKRSGVGEVGQSEPARLVRPPPGRLSKTPPPVGTNLRSGYALPSIRPYRQVFILIVAGF